MESTPTIETILSQIEDESVRMVAEQALETSRKALDMLPSSRVKFVADEIDTKMPRALRLRGNR